MTITAKFLCDALGCSAALADTFIDPINESFVRYGISTPKRIAAFLAQIGHESGALRYTLEVWGPTAAQQTYEGRAGLGNTHPGDGVRYRGRGLIQTTGRDNYRRLTYRLRERIGPDVPDFEANPEELEKPRWAALSAADYWDMNKLNALADTDSFVALGRAINRGNSASMTPANGEADRIARWERVKTAQRAQDESSTATVIIEPPAQVERTIMPIPAIVAALLPSIVSAIPKLSGLFGSGSEVSQRNQAAAGLVLDIVQQATGTVNAQEAVEKIASDPAAAAAATKAVEARWFELSEGGGGGVEGARKADAAAVASHEPVWRSPSFIIAVALLPLVYMIVGAVVGLFGAPFSEDVRAAIANGIVGLILGGLIGYYYGQTTSRNRTPA